MENIKGDFNTQIGLHSYDGNRPPRFTPISFGFQLGFGYKFEMSFSSGNLLAPMIEVNRNNMKHLGFAPVID